jgi:uncharacterized UPF0146 family protein
MGSVADGQGHVNRGSAFDTTSGLGHNRAHEIALSLYHSVARSLERLHVTTCARDRHYSDAETTVGLAYSDCFTQPNSYFYATADAYFHAHAST